MMQADRGVGWLSAVGYGARTYEWVGQGLQDVPRLSRLSTGR